MLERGVAVALGGDEASSRGVVQRGAFLGSARGEGDSARLPPGTERSLASGRIVPLLAKNARSWGSVQVAASSSGGGSVSCEVRDAGGGRTDVS